MAKAFLSKLETIPILEQSVIEFTCRDSGSHKEFLRGAKVFSFEIKAIMQCDGAPPTYEAFQDKVFSLLMEIEI